MSNLQQEALFIHQFSKEYPNSGSLTKMLTYFAQRLRSRIGKMGNSKLLIAIVTDVALYSPKSLPIIISIISYLIIELHIVDEQIDVVKNIKKKFERFPNIGELELWLQHITYGWQDNDYKEPLCRIVNGEWNVPLWNNEWVADSYIQGFPLNAICPDEARQNINPLVAIEEVSLFDFY